MKSNRITSRLRRRRLVLEVQRSKHIVLAGLKQALVMMECDGHLTGETVLR